MSGKNKSTTAKLSGLRLTSGGLIKLRRVRKLKEQRENGRLLEWHCDTLRHLVTMLMCATVGMATSQSVSSSSRSSSS